MCNGRKFCSKFFTQLFVDISGVIRLSTPIWVSLERSFPPLEVEYRQKQKAKARHGLHRSQWVKVELQNSKTKAAIYILVKKVAAIAWIHQILNLFDHEQYIFIFSQSRSDCFAERFVSNIRSMLDNKYYWCLLKNLFSRIPPLNFHNSFHPSPSSLPQTPEWTMAKLIPVS